MPRSRARRVARWLGYIAAALVILTLAAVVALQTPPARRYVQARVVELLAARDITFSSDELSYNLLDLSLDVRNLRLVSPRLPEAPPFLEIARARVDLSSWQVLRGRYVVESGSAEGVRLHYFVNAEGVDNLPRPPQDPDAPGELLDYLIESLTVPDAQVRYQNLAQDVDLQLPRASLTMAGSALTDRHDVTIEAAGGEVRAQGRDLQLDRLSAALDLGREDVAIERAELDAEGTQVQVSGSFGPFDEPEVNLVAQGLIDAARAVEAAGLQEPIAGMVSIEASATGPLETVNVDARVTGSDVRFRDLRDLAIDVTGSYAAADARVRVSRLRLDSPSGAIDGDGEIALGDAGESRVSARVQRLDAETVMRALGLDYRVASRVDGSVEARWPGLAYDAAAGNAQVRLTPTRQTAVASVLPVGGRIDARGSGSRVVVTLSDVRAAGAEAGGQVTLLNRDRLEGAIDVQAANVQTSITAIEAFAGRGLLVPMAVTGPLAAQARIGGRLAAPEVAATLQAPALTVGAAADMNVSGSLAYRRNALAIDRFDVLWQDARAHASGVVGLGGAGPLDLTVRAEAIQVADVLRAMERTDLSASGVVFVDGKVGGTLRDPAGAVNVRADEVVFADAALGTITADTVLAGGVATTTLNAESLSLTARSEVAVAAPYQATITANVDDLDLSDVPVKIDTPLEGRLRARASGSGPLAEPRRVTAEAVIDAFSGSWNEQPFSLDAPATLRYADDRVAIERLRLEAQGTTVEIRGELPVDRAAPPGEIAVDAQADLAALAQYLPANLAVAADGRLSLTGTLRGTVEAIDPTLTLALENALVLSPRIEPGLTNLTATAIVADGEATVESLTANWGSARIQMSARLPFDLLPELPVEIPRRGGPATVTASLDGLDPGAVPGAPAGLDGLLSADLDVSAARPSLEAAEGTLAFRDLRLAFSGLTLEQQAPSTIRLRNGAAEVEQFRLGGTAGTLAASGRVGLTGEQPIAVDVDGALDIAAVAAVTDLVRAEGPSVIDVTARGTLGEPILNGYLTVTDGTIVIDEPRIAADAVDARVDFDGRRVTLSTLTASVNGGTLTGRGGLAIGAEGIHDVNVEVATRDFAFDAPLDLRSLSDADVRITSQGDDIVVAGQVTIQEAGLTGDINFDTGLLATIQARPPLELTPDRNPLLERVILNVDVDTATPIIVDNNLAKAEVTTDLRVVGTPYETGLLGRLEILEGGMVTLNERTYEVERGQMTFLEDRRIFPAFDLRLTTSASNYDITLAVTGEPGDTETTLTSNPPLPEPDIMATLVTGRTLDEMRGEEYDVAREQVLSYLTGRVGTTLGRNLERATGLSTVRIEPQLIANEADPGARLTLGQDLSDDLSLAYSVDLANSDDQMWLATYDVTRRFQTRALRQSDNSYRVDFRHDIRKGGQPEPRRVPRVRPVVASVTVPDDAPLPAEELRDLLDVEAGDAFDYFSVRNGVEDIEHRLRERGWLQSRVRLDRSAQDAGVALGLRVTAGPQVEFVYAGANPPRRVRDEVRLQWHRGVFDAQRTDDVAETLVEWLMRDRHLQAKVEVRVEDLAPDRRRVHAAIDPGPRSSRVELVFEGASGISADELDDVIDEQRLERQLFTDPLVVTELLQRLYRERGYLNAEIDRPRYEFEGALARVVLAVREGPEFTVGQVSMSGQAVLSEEALAVDLPVVEGEPFRPAAVENALQHIRRQYWDRGYNDVRAAYQLALDRGAGRADVRFSIQEGRQAIVSDVRIAGNEVTSHRLVREQILVTPGEPLNLRALSRSRKNLYDSGAFSIVDLSRETVTEAGTEPAAETAVAETDRGVIGAITGNQSGQKPVMVDVMVREVQPYQFRYGASYDTEGKLGGVFDVSAHNVLGKARVLGAAGRYDFRERGGRIYLTQPTLRHWPIQTMASVYYTEERTPATDTAAAFTLDRRGVSIQQERQLRDSYVWTYGYRFERAHRFASDPLDLREPDQFIKVSPLTTAFLRETRDEVLDATRGSFSSHALSFSPSWLGSDDTYLKYFGQYFHYVPLQPERRRRFSNEIIRPRLVYAAAVRVGLSKGMGAFVPVSERFFAGGSTTVRGFEQNGLGPIGPTGAAIGGDALFVVNNELRFPLVSIVDGVTFLDVGNVFERMGDFSFGDLRRSAGVGVRLRTRWVLVRSDYGVILDRRPGEGRGRFYFSIGQAF